MELAGRQHRILTRKQLVACGLTRTAIAARIRRGLLQRMHRGVFVLGGAPTLRSREMAAVLACGESAALSGRSAAYLWDLLPYPAPYGEIEVAVSRRSTPNRPGLLVSSRAFAAEETTRRDHIPVLEPAAALLDLSARAPQTLDRAFDEAVFRRMVRVGGMWRLLERHAGERGVQALRTLVHAEAKGRRSRLEGEKRLKALVRSAALPAPEVNARLGATVVDMLWRSQKVIVEFDGFATHGNRRSFEADRSRDARLQAAGYRVLRVTWRQLHAEPHAFVARLAAVLAVAAP